MTSRSVTSKRKTKKNFFPPTRDFDSHLFLSEYHADRYDVNFSRQFVAERRIELKEDQYDTIRHEIIRRRWQEFVTFPLVFNIEIVREFYANAYPRGNNEQVMMSWVRGTSILFTEQSINEFLGTSLTKDEDRQYTARIFRGEPDFDVVEETLCGLGERFKRNLRNQPIHVKRTHLSTLAQAWATFMLCNLSPSNHTSAIALERANILVAIIKGWSVNVGKIIMKELAAAIMEGINTPFIFPCLITELCRAQGVNIIEPRCALIPTSDPITKLYIDRHCCGRPTYLDDDESPTSDGVSIEAESPLDPPANYATRGDILRLEKQLSIIGEKVDCILVRLELMAPHI